MPQPPADPKVLKTLNTLEKACTETREYLRQCTGCKLDVVPEDRKNEDQLEVVKRLKAWLFPTA